MLMLLLQKSVGGPFAHPELKVGWVLKIYMAGIKQLLIDRFGCYLALLGLYGLLGLKLFC